MKGTADPANAPPFSAEDVELLAYLLDEDTEMSARLEGIPRRQLDGKAPLSLAQERLWFLDQLEPGSPARNMSTAVRLAGALKVRALEQSLAQGL